MKKIYRIKRTLWYQDELTAPEDEKIADIHRFVLDSLYSGQTKIGETIEGLYAKQEGDALSRLQRIINIVLKPYEPTIIHRWWNKFWMKLAGMTSDTVYEHIPKSILVQIVADFFLFDLNWIPNLVNSILASVSSIPKMFPTESGSTGKS